MPPKFSNKKGNSKFSKANPPPPPLVTQSVREFALSFPFQGCVLIDGLAEIETVDSRKNNNNKINIVTKSQGPPLILVTVDDQKALKYLDINAVTQKRLAFNNGVKKEEDTSEDEDGDDYCELISFFEKPEPRSKKNSSKRNGANEKNSAILNPFEFDYYHSNFVAIEVMPIQQSPTIFAAIFEEGKSALDEEEEKSNSKAAGSDNGGKRRHFFALFSTTTRTAVSNLFVLQSTAESIHVSANGKFIAICHAQHPDYNSEDENNGEEDSMYAVEYFRVSVGGSDSGAFGGTNNRSNNRSNTMTNRQHQAQAHIAQQFRVEKLGLDDGKMSPCFIGNSLLCYINCEENAVEGWLMDDLNANEPKLVYKLPENFCFPASDDDEEEGKESGDTEKAPEKKKKVCKKQEPKPHQLCKLATLPPHSQRPGCPRLMAIATDNDDIHVVSIIINGPSYELKLACTITTTDYQYKAPDDEVESKAAKAQEKKQNSGKKGEGEEEEDEEDMSDISFDNHEDYHPGKLILAHVSNTHVEVINGNMVARLAFDANGTFSLDKTYTLPESLALAAPLPSGATAGPSAGYASLPNGNTQLLFVFGQSLDYVDALALLDCDEDELDEEDVDLISAYSLVKGPSHLLTSEVFEDMQQHHLHVIEMNRGGYDEEDEEYEDYSDEEEEEKHPEKNKIEKKSPLGPIGGFEKPPTFAPIKFPQPLPATTASTPAPTNTWVSGPSNPWAPPAATQSNPFVKCSPSPPPNPFAPAATSTPPPILPTTAPFSFGQQASPTSNPFATKIKPFAAAPTVTNPFQAAPVANPSPSSFATTAKLPTGGFAFGSAAPQTWVAPPLANSWKPPNGQPQIAPISDTAPSVSTFVFGSAQQSQEQRQLSDKYFSNDAAQVTSGVFGQIHQQTTATTEAKETRCENNTKTSASSSATTVASPCAIDAISKGIAEGKEELQHVRAAVANASFTLIEYDEAMTISAELPEVPDVPISASEDDLSSIAGSRFYAQKHVENTTSSSDVDVDEDALGSDELDPDIDIDGLLMDEDEEEDRWIDSTNAALLNQSEESEEEKQKVEVKHEALRGDRAVPNENTSEDEDENEDGYYASTASEERIEKDIAMRNVEDGINRTSESLKDARVAIGGVSDLLAEYEASQETARLLPLAPAVPEIVTDAAGNVAVDADTVSSPLFARKYTCDVAGGATMTSSDEDDDYRSGGYGATCTITSRAVKLLGSTQVGRGRSSETDVESDDFEEDEEDAYINDYRDIREYDEDDENADVLTEDSWGNDPKSASPTPRRKLSSRNASSSMLRRKNSVSVAADHNAAVSSPQKALPTRKSSSEGNHQQQQQKVEAAKRDVTMMTTPPNVDENKLDDVASMFRVEDSTSASATLSPPRPSGANTAFNKSIEQATKECDAAFARIQLLEIAAAKLTADVLCETPAIPSVLSEVSEVPAQFVAGKDFASMADETPPVISIDDRNTSASGAVVAKSHTADMKPRPSGANTAFNKSIEQAIKEYDACLADLEQLNIAAAKLTADVLCETPAIPPACASSEQELPPQFLASKDIAPMEECPAPETTAPNSALLAVNPATVTAEKSKSVASEAKKPQFDFTSSFKFRSSGVNENSSRAPLVKLTCTTAADGQSAAGEQEEEWSDMSTEDDDDGEENSFENEHSSSDSSETPSRHPVSHAKGVRGTGVKVATKKSQKQPAASATHNAANRKSRSAAPKPTNTAVPLCAYPKTDPTANSLFSSFPASASEAATKPVFSSANANITKSNKEDRHGGGKCNTFETKAQFSMPRAHPTKLASPFVFGGKSMTSPGLTFNFGAPKPPAFAHLSTITPPAPEAKPSSAFGEAPITTTAAFNSALTAAAVTLGVKPVEAKPAETESDATAQAKPSSAFGAAAVNTTAASSAFGEAPITTTAAPTTAFAFVPVETKSDATAQAEPPTAVGEAPVTTTAAFNTALTFGVKPEKADCSVAEMERRVSLVDDGNDLSRPDTIVLEGVCGLDTTEQCIEESTENSALSKPAEKVDISDSDKNMFGDEESMEAINLKEEDGGGGGGFISDSPLVTEMKQEEAAIQGQTPNNGPFVTTGVSDLGALGREGFAAAFAANSLTFASPPVSSVFGEVFGKTQPFSMNVTSSIGGGFAFSSANVAINAFTTPKADIVGSEVSPAPVDAVEQTSLPVESERVLELDSQSVDEKCDSEHLEFEPEETASKDHSSTEELSEASDGYESEADATTDAHVSDDEEDAEDITAFVPEVGPRKGNNRLRTMLERAWNPSLLPRM